MINWFDAETNIVKIWLLDSRYFLPPYPPKGGQENERLECHYIIIHSS